MDNKYRQINRQLGAHRKRFRKFELAHIFAAAQAAIRGEDEPLDVDVDMPADPGAQRIEHLSTRFEDDRETTEIDVWQSRKGIVCSEILDAETGEPVKPKVSE